MGKRLIYLYNLPIATTETVLYLQETQRLIGLAVYLDLRLRFLLVLQQDGMQIFRRAW
jgi:hypothetical protein